MKVKRTLKMKVRHYEVGDIISFKMLTGEKVELMAMEQKGDVMQFCFVDCLGTEYPMNDDCSNEGGYDESKLRKILNSDILSRFPNKILARMVKFENGDFLSLPTEKEMFGKNIYGEDEPENVKQWKPMKKRRNRIAFRGLKEEWEWYFLKNKVKESASDFCLVYDDGNATYIGAGDSCGVRPTLLLKNN